MSNKDESVTSLATINAPTIFKCIFEIKELKVAGEEQGFKDKSYYVFCDDLLIGTVFGVGRQDQQDFPKSRIEYIKEHLKEDLIGAATQTINLSTFHAGARASVNNEQLNTYLKVYEMLNEEFSTYVRKQRGDRTNPIRPEKILSRYEELCSQYAPVKKTHDKNFKAYCDEMKSKHRSFLQEDWEKVWKNIGPSIYLSLPTNMVELFASLDKPTAADVARLHVSSEFGFAPSTLERHVLQEARKARKDASKSHKTK